MEENPPVLPSSALVSPEIALTFKGTQLIYQQGALQHPDTSPATWKTWVWPHLPLRPSLCTQLALQVSSLCFGQDATRSRAAESASWCPRPTRWPVPCLYSISCVAGAAHVVSFQALLAPRSDGARADGLCWL